MNDRDSDSARKSSDAAADSSGRPVDPDDLRSPAAATPLSIVRAVPGTSLLRASFAAYEAFRVGTAGRGSSSGTKELRRFSVGSGEPFPRVAAVGLHRVRPEFVVAPRDARMHLDAAEQAAADSSATVRRKLFSVRAETCGEKTEGGIADGGKPAKRLRVARPDGFLVSGEAERTQPNACEFRSVLSAKRVNRRQGPLQTALSLSLRRDAQCVKDALQTTGDLRGAVDALTEDVLSNGLLVHVQQRSVGVIFCKAAFDRPAHGVSRGCIVGLLASTELGFTENGALAFVRAPWTALRPPRLAGNSQFRGLSCDCIVLASVMTRVPNHLVPLAADLDGEMTSVRETEFEWPAISRVAIVPTPKQRVPEQDVGRDAPKSYDVFAQIPLHAREVLLTASVIISIPIPGYAVIQDSSNQLALARSCSPPPRRGTPGFLGQFRISRLGVPAYTVLRLCGDAAPREASSQSNSKDELICPVFIQTLPAPSTDCAEAANCTRTRSLHP